MRDSFTQFAASCCGLSLENSRTSLAGMWCNKYTPTQLDAMDYHRDATRLFISVARAKNPPHLLVHGPRGSGRHTRILAYIRSVYGVQTLDYIPSTMLYETNTDTCEVNILSTACHLELNPSEMGNHDVFIIQTVLKETASTSSIGDKFKVVVLQDADKLSFTAQQALRRLMEQYAATCKLILVAESISGLISPIVSRCFCIRVPGFSDEEIVHALDTTITKHRLMPNFTKESLHTLLPEVAAVACGDLRRAFLLLQTYQYASAKRNVSIQSLVPEWETLCTNIASQVATARKMAIKSAEATKSGKGTKPEQSDKLEIIRTTLVEMLKKSIPADMILAKLYEGFKDQTKGMGHRAAQILLNLADLAMEYEARLVAGSNPLYHLEAFSFSALRELITDTSR